jgi:tetratricopeptide (TPR) repeat protein/TolB-like protein/DNA-binding winged helix-turn-helix (wHTH) protein
LRDFLIEPAKGRITGPQASEHLPPKAVEVLLCLAARPGDVVARDSLIKDVWGADGASQEALSHAVSEIRHALGDHRDDPEFIQTLPKRGYRLLVSPVSAAGDTGTIVLGAKNSVTPEELGLFENLKQRGVLETGLAYLILGWLLIQIADIVFGQLLLPQWVGTFVTVLVIAGFPIALVLSWFLEFRDGRAVIDDLSPKDARRRRFGRTYVSVIGALGIAAVLVFIYDKSVGLPEQEAADRVVVDEQFALPPVLDNSIAVLPFLNIDGSETTEIFANGLVDDVITRLSRVPGLLVSSRGDSFTLEPNSASGLVRQRLRVATYLEGSVQTDGDTLRIIVQMIDSETGFHILSRSFDRPREGFFDVRDEVTQLTVANVRVALPVEKRDLALQSDDISTLDAYMLYRRGIDATHSAASRDSINEALQWFDEALKIDPYYAAAHAGKCVTYENAYRELHEAYLIEEAQAACATALQLNPNLVIVHAALGDLYFSVGNLAQSEQSYLRALEIDPSSSESYMGLGNLYLALSRPDDAEKSLRQAIGLHPGDWAPYNRLGNYLFKTGRYIEAAQQYEYAVALDRANSNVYSNLGAAYMLGGDFVPALSAFEKSLEIDPRATTYTNLGMLHYYLGHLEDSVYNHRKAVVLEPSDRLSHTNLGDALWISGDQESAREVFYGALRLAEEALSINSSDPLAMMDMAWIYAMLDNADQAASMISRALELAPDDPYTHYYDGLVQFRAGRIDDAISAFRRAVTMGYPVAMLGAEPHLEALHSDPRFLDILSKG